MNLLTTSIIAFALAMDAFAVSIASGIAINRLKIKHALTIAAWFGSFQAIMPLIGWLGGLKLKTVIAGLDHWIAFALLLVIGLKMIWESFKMDQAEQKTDPTDIYILFILSLATSIDALAAGISFAMLNVSIITPIIVIGLVTFGMSFVGVLIGNKAGHFCEKRIQTIAGLILIAIGIKILFD